MPTAAAVMTAVASQPSVFSHGFRAKSPMTSSPRGHVHDQDHDRHRRDAVDDGAEDQRLDRIERGEIEERPHQRRACDRRRRRPAPTCAPPRDRCASRASRQARKQRSRPTPAPRADPCRRSRARRPRRPIARNGLERLGGVRGGLDFVTPCAFKVAAVVRTMKSATTLDTAMPTQVSRRMR